MIKKQTTTTIWKSCIPFAITTTTKNKKQHHHHLHHECPANPDIYALFVVTSWLRHPPTPTPTPTLVLFLFMCIFVALPPQYFSFLCVFICVFVLAFSASLAGFVYASRFQFLFWFLPQTNPHPLLRAPCLRCQFPLELILCLNLRIVVLPPSSCRCSRDQHQEWSKWTPAASTHPPPTLVKFNKGRAFVSPFWWWLPRSWIVLAGTHRVRQKPPAAFLYAPIIQSPIELQQQRLLPKVNAQKRSRRNDNQQ